MQKCRDKENESKILVYLKFCIQLKSLFKPKQVTIYIQLSK